MSPTTSAGNSRANPTKVIYVMGAGRSGSTILGVTLGNCAGVFFAGELDKWLAREGEPRRRDSERVDFWRRVRLRVGVEQALRKGGAHRYLERSSALFRLGRLPARRRLKAPYRRTTEELYQAVAATAGVSCVVDTSHYPLRARELQALDGVELYLLLVVRDPQEVVASFARDDVAERRFSPLTTRAYLLLTYLLSAWVFLKHPSKRRAVLFYEDLLEHPDGTVLDLLGRFGCDTQPPDFTSLATGIPFHGNRLIDAESVSLQRTGSPPAGGSLGGRIFAGALTGTLSRLRPRVRPRLEGEGSRPRAAAPAR
jgi:hypothetical protein